MTAVKKEKSCQELIHGQWHQRQEDLKNPDFEALGFDWVEPNTFTDQREGYWRWQFSWGGPSDELRGYINWTPQSRPGALHRLEYWYLDWGDGACHQIHPDSEAWAQMQEMIDGAAA